MDNIVLKEKELVILEKTPRRYVKKRVGRGGKELDYVETGYVISKLNELCNYNWSFSVLSKERVEDNIVVLGRLILHTKNGDIIKEQFGSSEVKRGKDGKIIDLADDFKAAASDALKKCASLVGIAQDIYWRQEREEIKTNQKQQNGEELPETKQAKMTKALHTVFGLLCKKADIKNSEANLLWREFLSKRYNVSSSKELDQKQASELLTFLHRAEITANLTKNFSLKHLRKILELDEGDEQ